MIIRNAAIIIPAGPLPPHMPSAEPAQCCTGRVRHSLKAAGSTGIISKQVNSHNPHIQRGTQPFNQPLMPHWCHRSSHTRLYTHLLHLFK